MDLENELIKQNIGFCVYARGEYTINENKIKLSIIMLIILKTSLILLILLLLRLLPPSASLCWPLVVGCGEWPGLR